MDVQDEMAGVETGDAAEAERIEAENRAALETAQQAAAERAEAEARARVREEARQPAPTYTPPPGPHGGGGGNQGGGYTAPSGGGGYSDWGYSPFRKGGRVGYSKGGIVDLLK